MGKQSRRKRQRSKRPSSSTAAACPEDESPSSLLQKLRHSDPQTCHAALIGLTCTLLHPEQLSSSNTTNRVVSSELLNTIRELILHDNLECAYAAATCCVNFLQYGIRRDKNELTAGWTLVLLQRLQSCQEALCTSNNNNPERKLWLAVTSQCLTALCSLVEMNPLALDYIQKEDENAIHMVPLLLSFVKFTKETYETASINNTIRSEEQDEYIRDISIYSLRILHSALDDNVELWQTWISSNNAMEEWKLIHQACTCESLPISSRLHAAACLVTARPMCIHDVNTTSDDLFANWCQQSVFLLQQSIILPPQYPVLLQESILANALLQQQEEDVAMEQNVIAAMDTKKEPARDIAKRHAQLKQANNSNNDNDNDEMKQDTTTTTTTPVDGQEAWNQFQRDWQETISPIQLALELVTNVTSVEPLFDDDNDAHSMNTNQEMEEMTWGPEQEEALVMHSTGDAGVPTTLSCHPLDEALLTSLAQCGLGDTLLTLLQSACSSSNGDEDSSLPASVKQDVEELQSKCAAALGNYLGNVTDWQIPTTLWKDLQLAAQSSTGAGTEGVFDVMAVAMQTRPLVRRQIQQEDLEFLMGHLSSSTCTDKLKANVVSILGLLCSTESHPNQVNEKVCSGLLSLLQSSSSAMVLSDVLNALMDMYGDDGHVQVFESLHVLANFQRNVPRFKQRIQAERNKAPSENVQEWNETALNASRFISYKKGQL